MKTRARTATKKKVSTTAAVDSKNITLETAIGSPGQIESKDTRTLLPAERPSRTFILPSSSCNASPEEVAGRFLSLPNPRTAILNPYYFSPTLGLHEFTLVTSQPWFPRSILVARASPLQNQQEPEQGEKELEDQRCEHSKEGAMIVQNSEIMIATPIDILFLMLPVLSPPPLPSSASSSNHHPTRTSRQQQQLFQSLDDILDSQQLHEQPRNNHLRHVLYDASVRSVLESRTEAVCDVIEAGDEKMYRLSVKKLIQELVSKAKRMSAQGLPDSLEERFVRQALVTPLPIVKPGDKVVAGNNNGGMATEDIILDSNDNNDDNNTRNNNIEGTINLNDDINTDVNPSNQSETQCSNAITATPPPLDGFTPVIVPSSAPPTQPSTTSSLPNSNYDNSNEIVQLIRIRVALSFIQSSYLPAHLSALVDEALSSPDSPIDFSILTAHLKRVAELRAEAQAAHAACTDLTLKKRRHNHDYGDGEKDTEKGRKRRKEDENRNAARSESRAVKGLKKVDTSGMKKISAFFAKTGAPAATTPKE